MAVRKAMDYIFSQHDLGYLDDVMPEKDKKKKEDEKKKKKKKGSIDSDINYVRKRSWVSLSKKEESKLCKTDIGHWTVMNPT